MFSQLASSLTGLPTIRSYGVEKLFIRRFADTLDLHSATFFTFISCSRFYGIFLDVVCALYIYCLLLVIGLQIDAFTSSIIGLTISQSTTLCAALNWVHFSEKFINFFFDLFFIHRESDSTQKLKHT